jgi:hypothetical protein
MNDQEYERRSLDEAYRHMQEVERAPLSDRKEAQAEFLEAMKDPALVAERLGWLFDGNYGYGEMMKARQVLGMGKNANKVASLNQLVGAYEWQCPPAMAVAAWKKLSASEKDMLDRAIKIVIEAAEKELKEQG